MNFGDKGGEFHSVCSQLTVRIGITDGGQPMRENETIFH